MDLFKTMYIILLFEGLAVHPKLFLDPLVDRDRRLAQGWCNPFWNAHSRSLQVLRFKEQLLIQDDVSYRAPVSGYGLEFLAIEVRSPAEAKGFSL
jgi:hypothetical protein